MVRKLKVLDNNKKHLTNEEKEIRKKAENLASDGLGELQVSAPNHMNSIAKAEYKRIINDLQKLPLRNLDRATLENYCIWYSVFKECSRVLTNEGTVVNGIAHPILGTLEKATKNIRMTSNDLGLTVDSRMRIFIPNKDDEKKSMFDKFG